MDWARSMPISVRGHAHIGQNAFPLGGVVRLTECWLVRGHAHIDTKRREPWLFGDTVTTRVRAALRSRYMVSMQPSHYTLSLHGLHATLRSRYTPPPFDPVPRLLVPVPPFALAS